MIIHSCNAKIVKNHEETPSDNENISVFCGKWEQFSTKCINFTPNIL